MKKVKVVKKDEVQKPPPKNLTPVERLDNLYRAQMALANRIKQEMKELKANGYN